MNTIRQLLGEHIDEINIADIIIEYKNGLEIEDTIQETLNDLSRYRVNWFSKEIQNGNYTINIEESVVSMKQELLTLAIKLKENGFISKRNFRKINRLAHNQNDDKYAVYNSYKKMIYYTYIFFTVGSTKKYDARGIEMYVGGINRIYKNNKIRNKNTLETRDKQINKHYAKLKEVSDKYIRRKQKEQDLIFFKIIYKNDLSSHYNSYRNVINKLTEEDHQRIIDAGKEQERKHMEFEEIRQAILNGTTIETSGENIYLSENEYMKLFNQR